jgi:hypothetical protein
MSHPPPARGPRPTGAPGQVALWAGLGAVAMAATALVLGTVGAVFGADQGSVSLTVAMRGLLTLVGVLLVARVLVVRAMLLGLSNPLNAAAYVAALGYALDPLTWTGRAVATQLVLEPGISTAVGDLALWLAAAGAGILWGERGVRADDERRPGGTSGYRSWGRG